MSTIVGIAIVLLALYLAFRLLESMLKVLACVLVLVGVYWVAAPSLGWPPLPELLDLARGEIEAFAPLEWLAPLWELLQPADPPAAAPG